MSIITQLELFSGKKVVISLPKNKSDSNISLSFSGGIVVTCPLNGLWEPTDLVRPEDVAHLKNRFQVFENYFATIVNLLLLQH